MNHYRPRRPAGTPGVGKTPDVAGVYYILNRRNDRIYVGQSKRIHARLYDHAGQITSGWHHNDAIRKDVRYFGADAFEFGILTTRHNQSPLSLLELERIFIRVYQSENPIYGYNTSREAAALTKALTMSRKLTRHRKGY